MWSLRFGIGYQTSVTLDPEKERKSRGKNTDNQYIIWVSSHVLTTGLFYLTWDSGNFCWRKVLTGPNSNCRRKINICYLWAASAFDNVVMHYSDHYYNWIFSDTVISALSFEKMSLINPAVAEKKLYSFFYHKPTSSKKSHNVNLYNGGYSSWKGRFDRKTLKSVS